MEKGRESLDLVSRRRLGANRKVGTRRNAIRAEWFQSGILMGDGIYSAVLILCSGPILPFSGEGMQGKRSPLGRTEELV